MDKGYRGVSLYIMFEGGDINTCVDIIYGRCFIYRNQ